VLKKTTLRVITSAAVATFLTAGCSQAAASGETTEPFTLELKSNISSMHYIAAVHILVDRETCIEYLVLNKSGAIAITPRLATSGGSSRNQECLWG